MVHDTESYANIGGIVSTLDGFKAYVDSPMYESYDDVNKDDNYLCIHLDGEDSLGEDGIIKLCQKHRDDNVTKLFFRMNGDYEYTYGMILYDQHKESYFRSENDFIRVVQSVVTELPKRTFDSDKVAASVTTTGMMMAHPIRLIPVYRLA